MREVRSHRTIGLRTRLLDGSKRCVAGSKLGMIGPADIFEGYDGDRLDVLLITEGESDAAAALDLGFPAIARPGCETCRDACVAFVVQLNPGRTVIVADADDPGQRGGHALARAIAGGGVACRVLTLPGVKDLRAFKATPDGTHHDLQALIDAPAAHFH